MTFEFERSQFRAAAPRSVLVLVDPCKRHVVEPAAPVRTGTDNMLANCRRATTHARALGIPVAFVRNRKPKTDPPNNGQGWIDGFEPRRNDSVFERVGISCYGSPYFSEVVDGAGGNIVVAGFVGHGGCLATAADAVSARHRIVFLSDALQDDLLEPFLDAAPAGSQNTDRHFDIRVTQTQSWATEATVSRACDASLAQWKD